MITLSYTMLSMFPLVLGLLAILLGWALGWAMASPLPQYDAYEACTAPTPSGPSRSRTRRPKHTYRAELGLARRLPCHTRESRANVNYGVFGVPTRTMPMLQVLGIIQLSGGGQGLQAPSPTPGAQASA